MTFIDFIGFFILIFSLGFLLFNYLRKSYNKTYHPLEYEKEENSKAERLESFLKSLDPEIEKAEKKAAKKEQKQAFKQKQVKHPPINPIKSKKSFDFHHYGSVKKSSRGRELLNRISSPQEMVILHEIFGPPKSER